MGERSESGIGEIFSGHALGEIFPEEKTDAFFEALYGDRGEGAYDIRLVLVGWGGSQLRFEFQLHQRTGKCLSCSLTYGLPSVFLRHPTIDLKGLLQKVDRLLCGRYHCREWHLGATREISKSLHTIPLTIHLAPGTAAPCP